MKVMLLAGGYGTRFGKLTDFLPKPMIPIGPFPILCHIMRYYAHFGHNEFIVCSGYKSELIKEYFLNLATYSHDFTIGFSKNGAPQIDLHDAGDGFSPRVTIAYTGQDTMTGARIKRAARYLGDSQRFMVTYGDGVTDLGLDELVAFHKDHGKAATLTSVFPPPRFGALHFEGDRVTHFAEKDPQQEAMVNGGYYVFERSVLETLSTDPLCVLEKAPMHQLSEEGELMAFRHPGYWQCMDTTRDLESLQEAWASGAAPWKVWQGGYED